MSSKRKGKGKLKEVARQDMKFVNNDALVRFETLKSSSLIYERAFKMEVHAWSREYAIRIREFHWETLCHPRLEAILPWVFEFYANALSIEGEKVKVRGQHIDISAIAINDFFELDNETHYARLNANIDPTELVSVVCNSLEQKGSRAPMKALKSTSLRREAKVWLLFINASLMPTRHLNNVTYNRLVLIYYILKRIKFNVGEVISKHIKMRAQDDTSKPLWFPTMITDLCRRYGVVPGEGDLLTPVTKHITENVIKANIKVADEFDGGKERAGERSKPRKVNIPSGKDATLEDVMDSVEFIKAYQRCHHLYSKSRMDHMEKKVDLLLRKAKIPAEPTVFEFQSQFDDKGNLLDEEGNNLDPTEYIESDSNNDEEADDADEEEADDDYWHFTSITYPVLFTFGGGHLVLIWVDVNVCLTSPFV